MSSACAIQNGTSERSAIGERTARSAKSPRRRATHPGAGASSRSIAPFWPGSDDASSGCGRDASGGHVSATATTSISTRSSTTSQTARRGGRAGRVERAKTFEERYGDAARARIGGLSGSAYTRLGAPIRHLTVLLARQRSRVRLLFLLSDGKPNDEDEYEGRYGIEDTRQA